MKKICGILALLALFVFSASMGSAETGAMRAEGYAPVTLPNYKSLALDLALKNAVEQVLVEQFGKEETKSAQAGLEANIYNASKGFAAGYRVLSEGSITHTGELPPMPVAWLEKIERTPVGVELYHVWAEVTLDRERLKKTAVPFMSGSLETQKATITIHGVLDYAALESVKAAIENTGAVRSLAYSSFSRGKAVFFARVGKAGAMQAMQAALKGSYVVTEDQPNVFSIKLQKAGDR